jgi:Flp pilus assembly protein TadD
MEAFATTVKLQPDSVKAHNNLAMAYIKLDRWQDAAKEFKKAISLKANDPEAHYGLCAYYIKVGDREAAAKEYQALQRLDKKLAQKLADLLQK